MLWWWLCREICPLLLLSWKASQPRNSHLKETGYPPTSIIAKDEKQTQSFSWDGTETPQLPECHCPGSLILKTTECPEALQEQQLENSTAPHRWALPEGNQAALYENKVKLYSKIFAQLAKDSLDKGKPHPLCCWGLSTLPLNSQSQHCNDMIMTSVELITKMFQQYERSTSSSVDLPVIGN